MENQSKVSEVLLSHFLVEVLSLCKSPRRRKTRLKATCRNSYRADNPKAYEVQPKQTNRADIATICLFFSLCLQNTAERQSSCVDKGFVNSVFRLQDTKSSWLLSKMLKKEMKYSHGLFLSLTPE